MAKAKVLLASSTKIGLELMRRCLRDLDLWILTAEDGPTLLQLAHKHRPQLIFMDMELSGKSGVECCWHLRSTDFARTIPIVLITTGHTWDTIACLASGCSEVLSRPFDKTLFVNMGSKLLGSIELRETRVPCRATIHCRYAGHSFYGTLEDISPHGVFVGTSHELQIDDAVRLRFSLPWPEAKPIAVEARVAWVNKGKRRQRSLLPHGFGVVFSDPPPQTVEHIEEFIEHNLLLLSPPEREDS